MVFYSKSHFLAEPVRTNHDAYSVAFSFLPKFTGVLQVVFRQRKIEQKLSPVKALAFQPLNVSFGPLLIEKGKEAMLVLYEGCEIVFSITTKVYDPAVFNTLIPIPFSWTMYIASCFRLPSDYSFAPIHLDAYEQFAEQYKKAPSDMIISLGDTVYLQNYQTGSRDGVVQRYKELFCFPFMKDSLSGSWWISCNDDHDLGINDTLYASYNIQMLRDVQREVFPRVSYGLSNTLNSMYNIGNITIIVLDDVSHRRYDIKKDNYISILGEEQLDWFCQALINVQILYGSEAIIFVVDGKSWFGSSGGQTFTACPTELDRILDTINTLNLQNVFHMCGDSHFSDQSYYPLERGGGITEFRNSAIGSLPRKNVNDNPYRVPGSLVDVNNFGRIVITTQGDKHTLTYEVYTKDGISYQWSKDE